MAGQCHILANNSHDVQMRCDLELSWKDRSFVSAWPKKLYVLMGLDGKAREASPPPLSGVPVSISH